MVKVLILVFMCLSFARLGNTLDHIDETLTLIRMEQGVHR